MDSLDAQEAMAPQGIELASESIERAAPVAPAPAATLQRTPLGDTWAEAVTALTQAGLVTALVRELAMQAELMGADGPRWTLRVERDSLRNAPLLDKLQAALRQLPGHESRTLTTEPGVAQASSTSSATTAPSALTGRTRRSASWWTRRARSGATTTS